MGSIVWAVALKMKSSPISLRYSILEEILKCDSSLNDRQKITDSLQLFIFLNTGL